MLASSPIRLARARVLPMPSFQRKSATKAKAAMATRAGSQVDNTGAGSRNGPSVRFSDAAEQGVQREKKRQVGDHADHRGGDPGEGGGQPARCPRSFSRYGAPRKIHRKLGTKVTHTVSSDPSMAAGQRIEAAGVAVGAEERHELHHQDQRTRGGFGQAQAVEHFTGAEPAVGFHRLLADVGEHRVGAAEGDHRGAC